MKSKHENILNLLKKEGKCREFTKEEYAELSKINEEMRKLPNYYYIDDGIKYV